MEEGQPQIDVDCGARFRRWRLSCIYGDFQYRLTAPDRLQMWTWSLHDEHFLVTLS
jgi:hypothetical protein